MNIVITGGSRGLGRAVAEKLHGIHTCIVIARASEALTETGETLHCPIYACDVTDAKLVEETIKTIEMTHGPIDVLINNAGIWIEGALETNSYEAIEQAIRTNILGVMFPTRAVVPAMKARKQGLIINVSSQAGFKTKGERAVYQAAKWAVRGFSLSLLDEVKTLGIRVTNFCPGTIDTGFFERAGSKIRNAATSLKVQEVANTIAWLIEQPASVTLPEVGIKNTWQ